MRSVLSIFAIAVLAVTVVRGADDPNPLVGRIRAEVAAVHGAADGFQQKRVEVEDVSLEGAEAVCFSAGEELRKIAAKLYGETYHASLELFYQDRELIFAFQRTSRYRTQVGLEEPPEVAQVEDLRLYFAGGRLFRCLRGPEALEPGSARFLELERSTLEVADAMWQACAR